MDFDLDLARSLTSEQLTCAQINQLKDAWQAANTELEQYKEKARLLERKLQSISQVIEESTNQMELQDTRARISHVCCSYPGKPVLLVKELARILPSMPWHRLTVTGIIRTGESWIALNSNAVGQETICFRSRVFEEMLRFRSRSQRTQAASQRTDGAGAGVMVETLTDFLPQPVINYIHTGSVPATGTAFEVFNDDSIGRDIFSGMPASCILLCMLLDLCPPPHKPWRCKSSVQLK